jgi:hypothetical protein
MHTAPRRLTTWLAALAMTAFLLLSMAPVQAANDNGDGNTGTIKVHDEAEADPDKRNEPHVDCEDFWVEGFKMAADSGTLQVFSWPPTGNKTLVLDEEWDADDGTPKNHFLEGPFTLTAGHYRVEVSDTDKQDGSAHTKNKMFWVEECEEPEEPAEEIECPTDLTATANDDGSITLTFTPAAGADGSNVYRADGEGDFVYLTTLSEAQGTYTDSTTEVGVSYTYTVTSLAGNEESEDCAVVEVTAIPDFPTTLGLGAATGGGVLAMLLARRRKA